MGVFRGPDPGYTCAGVYCHRIDEGGYIGNFERGHALGCGDTKNWRTEYPDVVGQWRCRCWTGRVFA